MNHIEFKQGKGCMIDFQNYLIGISLSYFKYLRYTTLRAWFQDYAPPMHKINVNYRFQHSVSYIKTWWKAGDFYPFIGKIDPNHPYCPKLMEKVASVKEKLLFFYYIGCNRRDGGWFKVLFGSEMIRIMR
jgi:hypothetical protein